MENPSENTNQIRNQGHRSSIVEKVKNNLIFRSKWAELNGAMGDLGTYIPIILALTLAKDLNLGTTLIFTGVYNFVTGAIYGVPMPVQPMKSIAAVAISDADFNIPEVMASGICTAGILAVLGVTGVNGAGDDNEYAAETESGANDASGSGNNRRKRLRKIITSLPSAFIIFLLGVVLAIIRGPKAVKGFKFGPSPIEVVKMSKHAWKEGFIKGTIPQLPLSILNSVIAVCKLSTDLFPEKDISATSVSITVGMMNLIGCWFGAMPCCHGAGGLAGQYKFGGRSGGCVALLGLAKLVLGLVLGSSLVKILDQFPVGVLGVLLLFAGIELAICSRDMNSKEDSFVMLTCTAVSLVGSSAALGFLSGIVVYLLLRLRKLYGGQSSSAICFHGNP
ncbi:molybdate transporter 1 isoform X2 [Coffea arabica]|uniref:Molybdate transporter 1 isoform X2 n=1 Tax=Coffea arabica TaxID=13443 RepID=A0A6P6TTA1_COFAR|nr:molybdate transporter 1-like isoform X2 [Coffea arabica]